jgi:hypothetical protein
VQSCIGQLATLPIFGDFSAAFRQGKLEDIDNTKTYE